MINFSEAYKLKRATMQVFNSKLQHLIGLPQTDCQEILSKKENSSLITLQKNWRLIEISRCTNNDSQCLNQKVHKNPDRRRIPKLHFEHKTPNPVNFHCR